MPNFASESISLDTFKEVLARYPTHVKNDLKELDIYRFETLPLKIVVRKRETEESTSEAPHLIIDKDELVELVTWKLKHGTFRPKLKALVESNDTVTVNKTLSDLTSKDSTVREKLNLLTQLKGIGPATASLVLSCIWPTQYPFFSDELFRWTHWDGKNADGDTAGIKAGKGWGRSIGYTAKEYESLVKRCEKLQDMLSERTEDAEKLSFLDVEKVAYVLGKEKIDVDAETGGEIAKEVGETRDNEELETTGLPKSKKRAAMPVSDVSELKKRPKRTKK